VTARPPQTRVFAGLARVSGAVRRIAGSSTHGFAQRLRHERYASIGIRPSCFS